MNSLERDYFTPNSESEWLDLRKPDLTSTMMPALFDLSPYTTAFELYHAKKSGVEVPFETNERVEKGKRIEEFAAAEVAADQKWLARRNPHYIRMPDLRLGSSFDFHAECPKRGNGILEIKAVDFFIHKARWSEDEVPAHIEVQVRHQMMLADVTWACVAAFTSIYDYHPYFFARDLEFEKGLQEAAQKFWADVDAGNEPRPDFYRDAPVIAQLYKDAGGELADKTGDKSFEGVAARFLRWKNEESAAKKGKEAAKAEMHRLLENSGGAYSDKYRVVAGWTKGSAGTVVTADMVGQVIGAKAGYRQCNITELNRDDLCHTARNAQVS